MPPRSTQDRVNQSSYIPPAIEQAMNSQLQSSLPVHLRQYVGPNRPAYIPRRDEQLLSKELQKLPTHLNQYAGAYIQQRVIQPGLNREQVSLPNRPPPTPSTLRRDHNIPFGEQHSVELNSLPLAAKTRFESSSGQPIMPEPLAPPGSTTSPPVEASPHPPGYEFIMNPQQPANVRQGLPSLSLPGMNPRLTKLIAALVGLLIIVIIYGIAKSALSGPSNVASLISVAQDQQELVHLSNNAAQEPDLSSANQLFVATTALVLTSNNTQLVTYLSNNGHKVSPSQLNLKISASTDKDLESAETAGTFNQSFVQAMQGQINSYLSDIRSAYHLTKGPKGQALLSSQFNQAKLIEGQLSSPSSS